MDAGYSWLTLLIDSSFASRFLIDRERRIVFSNRAAQNLFGYSDAEFGGRQIDVIFASREICEAAIPKMPLFSKRIVGDEGEIVGRAKSGKELILRVGTVQIDTLRQSYLSVTVFDITSFKQKQRELAFRARQLEEVNKKVSKFAYLVAHDLRADLEEILSASSKLIAAITDGRESDAAQAGETVRDVAARASDLVGDLLEYSQEAAAVLDLQFVDVREEVEAVLRGFSPAARANAVVQNKVPADLRVKADRPQFERLIAGLLTSSVDSIRVKGASEIIISALQNTQKNEIHLLVDSKASVGGAPEREPGPVDEGLSAIKSICERHGWRVTREPLPERGARYRVEIRTNELMN